MKQLGSFFSFKLNYKTLSKFALLIFFTESVRGAYMTFFPLYCREILKYSNVSIYGKVFFAYFFVETVSKVAVGWILDRFNNRIILMVGLAVSFAALYALKFITSPVFLVADGALIGFGFAPVWLIVLGHISSFSEENRSSSIGMIYAAWLVGLGFGTVSVTFIISKSFSMALNVLIFCWGLGMLVGFFINEGVKSKENQNKDKENSEHLLNRLLRVVYLIPGMTFQTLGITMLTPIISVYFTGTLGLTKFQYGLAQAVLGVTTVACLIVLSRFTRKCGVLKLFLYGLFFAAVGIFFVGHAKNIVLILIFGIIIGVSYSAILPSWYTIMSRNVSEKNNGLIWGIFSTLEGVGRALGPLLGGFIAQYYSMKWTFTVSAAIMLGLAILYFALSKNNILKISERTS